jgi:hypothetical protein
MTDNYTSKRRHTARWIVPGVFVVIAVIGGLAGCGASAGTDTASGGSSPTASPKTHASKPSPKPVHKVSTLLKLNGSGIAKTQQFRTGSNWTLKYSYDCSNFGSSGNFSVTEYTNGQLNDVLVNELKAKNAGSTPVYDSGAHYLEINSECDFSIKVVG